MLSGMRPAMSRESFFLTRDGLRLRSLTLRPPGDIRAVVAMVHGLAEHIDRYTDLHRALLDAGYAVAAADLRGFGHSPGRRGHIQGWADYRADACAILDGARALAPDAPCFLFGPECAADNAFLLRATARCTSPLHRRPVRRTTTCA